MQRPGGLPTSMRTAAASGSRATPVVEALVLVALGAAAAFGVLYAPSLHVPGHSILYAMTPIALGRTLVARRRSATFATGCAALTLAAIVFIAHRSVGAGGVAGLFVSGPALDLLSGRGRRRIGPILAGLCANAVAFVLHAMQGSMRWPWPTALASFLVCGLVAGALAAALLASRRT
jgi:hypothetical protein